MNYWQLYYHLVWGTKNQQPLITPEIEPIIYSFLYQKAANLKIRVLAIGGTENHVHVVALIPPQIAISTFVGQMKGATSAQFNKQYQPAIPFYWQSQFGAFSFSKKQLKDIIAYVQGQKEHHRCQTTIAILEEM